MNNESLALLTGLLTSLLLYSYAFSFEKLFLPRIITPVGWSQCPRTPYPKVTRSHSKLWMLSPFADPQRKLSPIVGSSHGCQEMCFCCKGWEV